MSRLKRSISFLFKLGLLGALAGVLGLAGLYLYIAPSLPDVEVLQDVRLQVPLRVYSRDGRLMGQFGDQRRIPVAYEEMPEDLVNAVIAAEDKRFFQHKGVDPIGLARSFLLWVKNRGSSRGGGASTIHMQVARNYLPVDENRYKRKFQEILLALKMDRELTKQQIVELYLNKIFLGQRAYGAAAAAEVYYGKTPQELTLAEIAMIAGLPQAPSAANPITDADRARARRSYVLRRMLEEGFITAEERAEADAAPITASLHAPTVELDAPYVAEMARQAALALLGPGALTDGYQVTTTLDSRLQRSATHALRSGLLEYDRRHGYRGHLDLLPLPTLVDVDGEPAADRSAIIERLRAYPAYGELRVAMVSEVSEQSFAAVAADGERLEVAWEGIVWARPYIDDERVGAEPETAADVVEPGAVVYLVPEGDRWWLAQMPAAQSALVSLDPDDGAVVALVGGYDFQASKFNRVVQAVRQPGSSFKPFIYSAALDAGHTAATVVNDAPVVFDDASLETAWRPENYSGRVYGPTRLREALVNSRNLVSIRVLRAIGVGRAVDFIGGLGFVAQERLPRDLSLALGSVSLRPLELAAGYALLANGGYRVSPYYIERIVDVDGQVVMSGDPALVCERCEREPLATVPGALGAQPAQVAQEEDAVAPEPGAQPEADVDPLEELPPDLSVDAGLSIEVPEAAAPLFEAAPRVMDERVRYLMVDMMRDVVRRGTARRAMELGRGDLAGKTGTTNDQMDAWFSGFNRDLVTTAWVGFDELKPLGAGEVGGRAALPIWIAFMDDALAGQPEQPFVQPEGLVTVRIDPETGKLAPAGSADAIFEIFREEQVPSEYALPDEEAGPYDPDDLDASDEDEDSIF